MGKMPVPPGDVDAAQWWRTVLVPWAEREGERLRDRMINGRRDGNDRQRDEVVAAARGAIEQLPDDQQRRAVGARFDASGRLVGAIDSDGAVIG